MASSIPVHSANYVLLLYFVFIYIDRMKPRPQLLWSFIGLLYPSLIIDGDDCGAIVGMNEWQKTPKYSEKTCPSAALSTIDTT
jgi:hypothetical protein